MNRSATGPDHLRVKVCGLTRVEDALHADACGAHALGFIFHPPSPRGVTPEQARRIIAALPPLAVKVGVFVGQPVAEICQVAEFCALDRIQLHGGQPFADLARLNRPGYRALRLKDERDLAAALEGPDTTVLLDTYDPLLQGGTGRPTDWGWAKQMAQRKRVILAGGLGPETIVQAFRTVHPYGVDASSGLESAPGLKDPAKVNAFFNALRTLTALPPFDAADRKHP